MAVAAGVVFAMVSSTLRRSASSLCVVKAVLSHALAGQWMHVCASGSLSAWIITMCLKHDIAHCVTSPTKFSHAELRWGLWICRRDALPADSAADLASADAPAVIGVTSADTAIGRAGPSSRLESDTDLEAYLQVATPCPSSSKHQPQHCVYPVWFNSGR